MNGNTLFYEQSVNSPDLKGGTYVVVACPPSRSKPEQNRERLRAGVAHATQFSNLSPKGTPYGCHEMTPLFSALSFVAICQGYKAFQTVHVVNANTLQTFFGATSCTTLTNVTFGIIIGTPKGARLKSRTKESFPLRSTNYNTKRIQSRLPQGDAI